VAYYLRLVVAMYLQKPLAPAGAAPSVAAEEPMLGPSMAMAIAAIAVIAIGIFPEDFLRQSAATVRTVLGP
jgi:NADH:ubiquinone oxidoreductase subunit 2 (subunit N)